MASTSHVVLPHENQREWETVRDGFLKTWAPANELEEALAGAVAETWWALQRQRRVEAALMQQRMKAVCETNPELTGDAALAFLMSDPDERKRMSVMLRFVTSAERAHTAAIRELQHVQKLRREAEPTAETRPQPAPRPVTPARETKPVKPRKPGEYTYHPTVPPRMPENWNGGR